MLAAYWGGHADSPVEQRAQVMREWWEAFDALHARQTPGTSSLWGLLGDRFEDAGSNLDDGRYTRHGYRMLPPDLNARIEQLWGTAVLPRWPDALVSEPYPHASFAETLGAGISFWHEIALTCWFICEGPSSRTDIGGMPNYYDREIKALEEVGCPIDPAMFADLREAEKRLTERTEPDGDTTEYDIGGGLSFSITISMGAAKMDGFEHLRDVVTRYRRAWAEQHLERYLRGRWERDLRSLGDTYHRHVADKGKPPTPKQFAKIAEQAANNWFGGDLAKAANSLGLHAPNPQHRRRLMPADRAAFVAEVRNLVGGQRWEDSPEEMDRDQRERRLRLSELAEHAPAAVQIWEATGEKPPLKGASWARHRLETAFGPDIDAGWEQFLDALDQALRGASTTPVRSGPERPVAGSLPSREPPQPLSARAGPDDATPPPRARGVRGFLSRLRG